MMLVNKLMLKFRLPHFVKICWYNPVILTLQLVANFKYVKE
jgi:hypothetical protein